MSRPAGWAIFIAACLVSLMFLLMALIGKASAHDQWVDGTPVPDWVKQYCCGPQDAHHYRFDEIKVTQEGYILPDYPTPIPANGPNVFKSEDGEYWAFFSQFKSGSYSSVYCFFVPPGST